MSQEMEIEVMEEDEVQSAIDEAQEALVVAKEFAITTQADLNVAGEILDEVKTRAKALATLKDTVVGPLNKALKAARDLFRPAEEALSEMEASIKGKVKEYNNAQLAKAQAAAKALQAAQTSAQAVTALAARVSAEVTAPKGVTMTRVWKFEVTDGLAVPLEYQMVNESAIRIAVKIGVRSIPGVRIWEDTQVAVRPGSK